MPADKYLRRDETTGLVTETPATESSAGAANAGDIPALGDDGRLSSTMMPVGVMADTYSGVASEALAAGDFVYIKSDGQVAKASAAVAGVQSDGFVLSAFASAASALVYFEGRNTSRSGLTVGARYYLSDTTPGGITMTPVVGAGKKHQFLGRAITATSLAFEGDDAIILA